MLEQFLIVLSTAIGFYFMGYMKHYLETQEDKA